MRRSNRPAVVSGVVALAFLLTTGMDGGAFGAPGEPAGAAPYKDRTGSLVMSRRDDIWRDEARQRNLPVRVLSPRNAEGESLTGAPLVVISHHLGGDRASYTYLGQHLCSHGYLVVHVQHPGTDLDTMRINPTLNTGVGSEEDADGRLAQRVEDGLARTEAMTDRPRDISFIIDHVSMDPALSVSAEVSRVGVAGLSLGAYSALAVGGLLIDLPDHPDASFRDKRVAAVVAFSPPGTGALGLDPRSWSAIDAPVLLATGARDAGINGRPPEWRLEAWRAMERPDARLLFMENATHFSFGDDQGKQARAQGLMDQYMHPWILQAATAFLDAHLRGSAEAGAWLDSGAIETLSKGAARIDRPGLDEPPATKSGQK